MLPVSKNWNIVCRLDRWLTDSVMLGTPNACSNLKQGELRLKTFQKAMFSKNYQLRVHNCYARVFESLFSLFCYISSFESLSFRIACKFCRQRFLIQFLLFKNLLKEWDCGFLYKLRASFNWNVMNSLLFPSFSQCVVLARPFQSSEMYPTYSLFVPFVVNFCSLFERNRKTRKNFTIN